LTVFFLPNANETDIDHLRFVVQAPRSAQSSEPPIEKPEPGAPRVPGIGIELDADLRDLVSLHVAHD
jgi:hypothetical protein